MAADLDQRLVAAYGAKITTASWLPPAPQPCDLVAAADHIAGAIGEVEALPTTAGGEPWLALPPSPLAPVTGDARRLAVARLVTWAEARGTRLPGIELRVDDAGACAAHARRPIVAGERVVSIPRGAMIVDDALAASATGEIDAFGPMMRSEASTLAVWLALEHREEASPWRAYLDALPASLHHLPCYRPRAELAELTGTFAMAGVTHIGRRIADQHALLLDEVRAEVGLAAFAWGRAIVSSRAYRLAIDGVDRHALIPISDLLDHRPGDTAWRYDDAEGALVYTALRGFRRGEPVHATYATVPNAHLLQSFGFALPDNPDDQAGLRFAAAPCVRRDLAAHLLWRLPLAAPTSLPVAPVYDQRFRRALSLARLRAAAFPAVRAVADAGGLAGRDLPWICPVSERGALREVSTAARRGLDRLAGHASDDAGWLADPARTPWQRACALVRHGERDVLHQVLAFTAAAAPHLAAPTAPALHAASAAIAADATGGDGLLRDYLGDVAVAMAA